MTDTDTTTESADSTEADTASRTKAATDAPGSTPDSGRDVPAAKGHEQSLPRGTGIDRLAHQERKHRERALGPATVSRMEATSEVDPDPSGFREDARELAASLTPPGEYAGEGGTRSTDDGAGGQPGGETGIPIGSSDSTHEREANRIASRVVDGAKTVSVTADADGGLRRQATGGGDVPERAPSIVSEVVESSGQPLDSGVRRTMESRFGGGFGSVTVHSGARAARSADAVNARAYTVGNDIVFNTGEYAPDSSEGRWMLAHELAHVKQHSVSPGGRDETPRLDRVDMEALKKRKRGEEPEYEERDINKHIQDVKPPGPPSKHSGLGIATVGITSANTDPHRIETITVDRGQTMTDAPVKEDADHTTAFKASKEMVTNRFTGLNIRDNRNTIVQKVGYLINQVRTLPGMTMGNTELDEDRIQARKMATKQLSIAEELKKDLAATTSDDAARQYLSRSLGHLVAARNRVPLSAIKLVGGPGKGEKDAADTLSGALDNINRPDDVGPGGTYSFDHLGDLIWRQIDFNPEEQLPRSQYANVLLQHLRSMELSYPRLRKLFGPNNPQQRRRMVTGVIGNIRDQDKALKAVGGGPGAKSQRTEYDKSPRNTYGDPDDVKYILDKVQTAWLNDDSVIQKPATERPGQEYNVDKYRTKGQMRGDTKGIVSYPAEGRKQFYSRENVRDRRYIQ